MTNIEFRSQGSHYSEPANNNEDQLTLALDYYPKREVHWVHGIQRWIGHRLAVEFDMDETNLLPKKSYIDTDAISELHDRHLRYALRFADAAQSVGAIQDGPYSSGRHNVSIIATDDGVESQLVRAVYSGIHNKQQDTFMDNLKSITPERDS